MVKIKHSLKPTQTQVMPRLDEHQHHQHQHQHQHQHERQH